MGFNAFSYGANVVSFIKNNQKYGMVCAWAMQVDYDKIMMLIGAQSLTGKHIEKGDKIGVSALNINQKDIVDTFGLYHSNQVDKFKNINYTINESAILIDEASNCMVVEVIDVFHLKGIEEDHLVYGLIKSYTCNDIRKFSL